MDIPRPGIMFDRAAMAGIRVATSVKPGDVTTSTVVDVSADPQIAIGRAEIITHSDIAFASRREDDGPVRELRLDLQRPAADGPHPLVVYVTGGGFMFVMKSNARELRTYVAESGFVVASIDYRTVTDGALERRCG